MRILISYDISDTKRRNKIATILEGHGYRVQYSVFECDLDQRKLTALRKRLRPLVKGNLEESIRFYPLTAECVERIHVLGKDLGRTLGPVEIV